MAEYLSKDKPQFLIVLWLILLFSSLYCCSESIYDGAVLMKKYAFIFSGLIFILFVILRQKQLFLSRILLPCFLLYSFIYVRDTLVVGIPHLNTVLPPLLVFALSILASHEKQLLTLCFIIACCSVSIVGILQFFGIIDSLSGFRVAGPYDNPAGYSATMACGLGASYLYVINGGSRKHGVILSMLLCFGMLLSGSRSGMLGMALLFLCHSQLNAKTKTIIGTISVGALFVLRPPSAMGRVLIWLVLFKSLGQYNMGIGSGPYAFVSDYMIQQSNYLRGVEAYDIYMIAGNVNNPFNEILSLIISYGVLGLFLVIVILAMIKKIKGPSYFFTIVPLFICSCLSYPFRYPVSIIFIAIFLASIDDDYKLYVKVPLKAVIMLLVFVICIFCAKDTIRDYGFEKNWRTASETTGLERLSRYESLIEEWNGDPYFLYNYALVLNEEGLYDSALNIMEKCSSYINDYDVQMTTSEILINLGEEEKALRHLDTASWMVPCKLFPQYLMMKIYQSIGDARQVEDIAERIINTPVKVQSSLRQEYVEEAMRLRTDISQRPQSK